MTDTKRTSRDWCHFLLGMLSGRLLLLMECFVRARNPKVHSRPSRERPLYMGGPFFLRMHYISLVKFTLRTTEAGQTIGFVNCTWWPTREECGSDPEMLITLRNDNKNWYVLLSVIRLNINTTHLTKTKSNEKVSFVSRYIIIIGFTKKIRILWFELRTWELIWWKYD